MTPWLLLGLTVSAMAAEVPRPDAKTVVARQAGRPIVIAHRGASHGAPENTLAAYRLAVLEGATVAETDVHLTQDGVVVAMHDTTVDRTTTGAGPVSEHTLASLTALEAGAWFHEAFNGEPIPTLEAILGQVGQELVMCIEVKKGNGIIEKIDRLVTAQGLRERVILFSFDRKQIRHAKQTMPDVPALVLFRRPGRGGKWGAYPVRVAQELGAELIGLPHRSVTPALVQQAHSAGIAVFVYTVNAPTHVLAMAQMGVDGIITDRPGETLGLLQAGVRPLENSP